MYSSGSDLDHSTHLHRSTDRDNNPPRNRRTQSTPHVWSSWEIHTPRTTKSQRSPTKCLMGMGCIAGPPRHWSAPACTPRTCHRATRSHGGTYGSGCGGGGMVCEGLVVLVVEYGADGSGIEMVMSRVRTYRSSLSAVKSFSHLEAYAPIAARDGAGHAWYACIGSDAGPCGIGACGAANRAHVRGEAARLALFACVGTR